MMKEEQYGEASPANNSFREVQSFLLKILRKWYWVVGSLVVALAVAYYLTATAERVYLVSASVLIKNPEAMGNTVKDVLYGDKASKSSNSIENETFLIKRFDLVHSTLEDLDFRVVVHHDNSPINVVVDSKSTYQPSAGFECTIHDNSTFSLTTDHDDFSDLVEGKTYKFGEIINLDGFIMTIFLDALAYTEYTRQAEETGQEEPIYFEVNDLDRMADRYIASLEVEPIDDMATILELSLESSWPAHDIKFLNQLTENYLTSGLKEKISTATQTMSFIDRQLGYISDSLNTIEGVREDFKQTQVVDLSKEGTRLYDNIQELEKEKANHLIQIEYLRYLKDYVQDEDNDFEFVTAPSSLGVSDNALNSLINQLVTEQLKLKQVNTNTSIENPRVKLALQRVDNLRKNIVETANNLLKGNRIASNDLERRISSYENDLGGLPEAERKLIDIERQYNLSETLYLFLMEKRTEAGILRASTVPDLQIVNKARLDRGGQPISPKPIINYASAVVLGLFLPILLIYLRDKFNDKVYTKEELTALTQVPMIGLVGQHKGEGFPVVDQPHSAIAEAFRSIRSNLRYMTDYGQRSQLFMVSSFVSGEGKTFCAKSLAYIFAIAGKRTVYVNTDLRKSNSYEEFGLKKTTGLSEYLIDVVDQEAVVHPTRYDNLFVVPSGKLPPNPSELLMKDKFREMLMNLKESFEYIIIDTPPRGVLSDAMELVKYADVEIFVVRQGYTTQQNVATLNQMYHHRGERPMGLIFNDVDFSRLEYGAYKNVLAYNYTVEGQKTN